MAVPALSEKVNDEKYLNYEKVDMALFYLKKGLCSFIEDEVKCLHESLKREICGNQTVPVPKCTSCTNNIKWNNHTRAWVFSESNQCQSKCEVWFHKLLELHKNQKSEEIYWHNSDVRLWAFNPWECAKIFMSGGLMNSNDGPDKCTSEALMSLLANCRYFLFKLSDQGHNLVQRISRIREKVMHDGEMKLLDADRSKFIEEIILLLEDAVNLSSREDCIAAANVVKKLNQMSKKDLRQLFDQEKPNQGSINQTQFQGLPDCDPFPILKRQRICMPNNPRCRQIIKWTEKKMKDCLGELVGTGRYGSVYKANFNESDSAMLSGNKRQYVIKKIKTEERFYRKSYEREINSGRILHPFINPIIVRAESPEISSERYAYLLFPYMPHKHLRYNINEENEKKALSKYETNSKIWMRCVYQIAQAVDYLHMNLSGVRGSVFHRDLTSNNILLDENFNTRISDFGIAVEAKMQATEATHTGRLGTKGYHPPHMNEKYIAAYDIFSVGVIMLEILTGKKAVYDEHKELCLYDRYQKGGLEMLKADLDRRADFNDFSRWTDLDARNKIAEIALESVKLDEDKKSAVNVTLVQKLKDLYKDSRDRYQSPKQHDRCVSCYVNTPVHLSLKGRMCLGYESTNPCQPFCLHCLMSHHYNPLVCPKDGNTRPPFGDHVYGVFVAGNGIDDLDGGKGAAIFMADVEKVVKALAAEYPIKAEAEARSPFSWKEHFRTVTPHCPNTEENMKTRIINAFADLDSTIREVLNENDMKPEERLPSSLFIFYFSGHCSAGKGLYLENETETISASMPEITEMLHIKLRVDKVLVILDCCQANSQDFVNTQSSKEEVRIFQLSSCDTNETSFARIKTLDSNFTHLFCQGLQGLVGMEGDKVKFCDSCEKDKANDEDVRMPCIWYHTECSKDHTVTLFCLIQYIQRHFDLSKNENGEPVKKRTVIHNVKGGNNLCMGYYNPDQFRIPIDLNGPEGGHVFYLAKPYPETVSGLKEDIIKYIVEKTLTCDVLSFHQSYSPYPVDTKDVVGIYPKYSRERTMELITLESIYRAWAIGVELEARVRDHREGLPYGPVMLDKINKSMVTDLEEINLPCLGLNSEVIRIPVKYIDAAIKNIRALHSTHEKFREDIEELLFFIQCDLDVEGKGNKELIFALYDQFCVLKMK